MWMAVRSRRGKDGGMQGSNPPSGRRVLVVDDHPELRVALCETLRGEGIDADAAAGGARALELLAGRRYDALLVDVRMPGMDGFALLEEMRRRGIACPAVMTSVAGGDAVRRRAHEAGAVGFHEKPFVVDVLVADLRAAMAAIAPLA
jgi:CheY-like chemotaxis protein